MFAHVRSVLLGQIAAEENDPPSKGEPPKPKASVVQADLQSGNWNKHTNILDIADICYGKKSMWMIDYLKDMTELRNNYIRCCMLIRKEHERGDDKDEADIAEQEAKKAEYIPEFDALKEKYLARQREE